MILKNEKLTIEISEQGAELKSVKKDGFEYMWCGDAKYWGRTSPVLFPFVGGLKDKKYRVGGKEYPMSQHGFARDCKFELLEENVDSVSYILKSNEDTLSKYPFGFSLVIKYTLVDSKVKVGWKVKNEGDGSMSFSIGAHPAFNLKEGVNYFGFDNKGDITYNLIDGNGLYVEENRHILKNDGFVKI